MIPLSTLAIDKAAPLSLHVQLMEQIKDRIESGTWLPGMQLPTLRALAVRLQINYNTVRTAYHELERQGYVITTRGRGTFVANEPPHRAAYSRDDLLALVNKALSRVQTLGMSAGEPLPTFHPQLQLAPLLADRRLRLTKDDQPELDHFMKNTIADLTIQAAVFQSIGQIPQGLMALEYALWLAEEYICGFLHEGAHIATLLSQADDAQPETRSASSGISLTSVVPMPTGRGDTQHERQEAIEGLHAAPAPLMEPLSERELHLLRLLATGRSNREIAKELIVAVGTVKWYLKTIYHKLNVHTRTEALARAKALKLLP